MDILWGKVNYTMEDGIIKAFKNSNILTGEMKMADYEGTGRRGTGVVESAIVTLPSHMLIAEYLNIVKSCEREALKFELMTLCKHLSKSNIIVPIDFQPYGKTLYSEIFDRDIMFLSSAGVICEKHSSIKYEITERGEKLLEGRDACYKNVPPKAIEALDKVLAGVGRRAREG